MWVWESWLCNGAGSILFSQVARHSYVSREDLTLFDGTWVCNPSSFLSMDRGLKGILTFTLWGFDVRFRCLGKTWVLVADLEWAEFFINSGVKWEKEFCHSLAHCLAIAPDYVSSTQKPQWILPPGTPAVVSLSDHYPASLARRRLNGQRAVSSHWAAVFWSVVKKAHKLSLKKS